MGQGVDQGGFRCEHRIEQMPVAEPLSLDERLDLLRISQEVDEVSGGWRLRGRLRGGRLAKGIQTVALGPRDQLHRHGGRGELPVFPTTYRDEGNAHELCEADLGEAEACAEGADAVAQGLVVMEWRGCHD